MSERRRDRTALADRSVGEELELARRHARQPAPQLEAGVEVLQLDRL